MKALVLGGEGYIGAHLVERLLADGGHDVRVLSRKPGAFLLPALRAQVEFFHGDFADPVLLRAALAGCDVVFHLISTTIPQTASLDPVFDVQSNLVGTQRMLAAAADAGVKRVVFVSSGGTVYGIPRALPLAEDHPTDPLCAYGATKLAIEKFLHVHFRERGTEYVVLRVANPYGGTHGVPRKMGAIDTFIGRMRVDAEIVLWGSGEIVRDYVHIDDAVEALLLAAAMPAHGDVFNIGSGVGHSLLDLLAMLQKVTGIVPRVRHEPARHFDVPANILAVEKFRRIAGWQPRVSLAEGLAREWRNVIDEAPAGSQE